MKTIEYGRRISGEGSYVSLCDYHGNPQNIVLPTCLLCILSSLGCRDPWQRHWIEQTCDFNVYCANSWAFISPCNDWMEHGRCWLPRTLAYLRFALRARETQKKRDIGLEICRMPWIRFSTRFWRVFDVWYYKMQLWTFGLTLLLVLSTGIIPSNGDDDGKMRSHNIEIQNIRCMRVLKQQYNAHRHTLLNQFFFKD